MDEIIPKSAQVQIEELTETKLVEDLNLQLIRIGSASSEAGERALHKLDILRKSFVSLRGTSIDYEKLTFEGHCATHSDTPRHLC